jgi:hypothetical protein
VDESCEACERAVDGHEGPHAAREYQFVARGIAGALTAVGAGASYRQAAFVARERAQRMRSDPVTGEICWTRHGSLVMDWSRSSLRSSLSPTTKTAQKRHPISLRFRRKHLHPPHSGAAILVAHRAVDAKRDP